jgi:hypothetical protein
MDVLEGASQRRDKRHSCEAMEALDSARANRGRLDAVAKGACNFAQGLYLNASVLASSRVA